jgi:hypothetical protein
VRRTILLSVFVVVSTCLTAASARAQWAEAREVAAGYSFLAVTDSDVTSMPAGWMVSGAVRLNHVASLVGEVAGNYTNQWGPFSIHTLTAGVRFSPARSGVRPYGEVLAGGAFTQCCINGAAYFTVEPGGGVEIPVSRRAAVRLGASVPIAIAGGDAAFLIRVQAGLAFRIGAH